ncbi:MAG TPA: hypothetical protein VEG44_02590 [Candidatus Acidoferrales bacterium]|nr:hypothetical protein [Candidatus Acidoferrales bacterium]
MSEWDTLITALAILVAVLLGAVLEPLRIGLTRRTAHLRHYMVSSAQYSEEAAKFYL